MTNAPVAPRRRAVWDIVLTVLLLVATFVILAISAVSDVFIVAFTDYCPSPCHVDVAINAVFIVFICAGVLALAATAVSIIQLVRRRRAWWIALIGLVLVVIASIIAFALYVTIVG